MCTLVSIRKYAMFSSPKSYFKFDHSWRKSKK